MSNVSRQPRGASRASRMVSAARMSRRPPPIETSLSTAFSLTFSSEDRRECIRRRVRLRAGRVLDGEGRFLCEATILDLSPCGARLRLADPARLPETLWLFDEAGRRAAFARVARRTAIEAGLAVSEWRALEALPPATRRRLESPYYAAD